MRFERLILSGSSAIMAAAMLAGCGGSSGGAGGSTSSGPSSGTAGSTTNPNALPAPMGIADNNKYVDSKTTLSVPAGQMLLSSSGEVLSLNGFDWPPMGNPVTSDTCMVDGWRFQLYRYISVFTNVTLWSNPNMVPGDQSQHGPVVAQVVGPWVVDLHKGGPLMGKGGGGEQAVPFAKIVAQDDGSAFDTTAPYGFGFSTIPATANVYNINLDSMPGPDGMSDLDAYNKIMIPNGYSVLYMGVATYDGAAPGAMSCDMPTSGTVGPYDFTKLPKTLPFTLGFSTPTDYVNCQNGTDLPGMGVNGEAHPRGVQFLSDKGIIAQVTIHMDHPFWESFAENSPVHWDQIAARYVGVMNPTAKTEDLKGVNFTAFTDKNGLKLPWRTCDPAYYTTTGMGQLAFDPLKVKVTLGGSDPAVGLRDYYDFIRYTQATQGHLNSQGLCFIARQYPSPPGGSG